jgi:hypothetical protein
MHPVVMLAISALIPLICLGLLMWLSWLEDTLPADVRKTERSFEPDPILAVPVEEAARVPVQRSERRAEPQPETVEAAPAKAEETTSKHGPNALPVTP